LYLTLINELRAIQQITKIQIMR